MAESMKGLKRTHRCTEISTANIGENVTLMGSVSYTHLQLQRCLGNWILRTLPSVSTTEEF